MDGRELKQWESWKQEVQRLRSENQHLRLELDACRPALYRADQQIDRLRQRNQKLNQENRVLRQRVVDLTMQLKSKPKAPPAFVKANVADKPRRKPGRRV